MNTVHTAALAKMTKPAVVHPGKILPGKLLFSLSIRARLEMKKAQRQGNRESGGDEGGRGGFFRVMLFKSGVRTGARLQVLLHL